MISESELPIVSETINDDPKYCHLPLMTREDDKVDFSGILKIFSSKVINIMEDQGVLITPKNFEFFFIQEIQKISVPEEKVLLEELSGTESSDNKKRLLELEKYIDVNLNDTTKLLHSLAEFYASSHHSFYSLERMIALNDVLHDPKDLAHSLHDILLDLIIQLKEYMSEIHTMHSKILSDAKHAKENTVYHNLFDVYKRSYLARMILGNLNGTSIQEYIAVFKLSHSALMAAKSISSKKAMVKLIGHKLVQIKRNKDMVAYLGQGIFAVYIPHSNITSIQKTSERIQSVCSHLKIQLDNDLIPFNLDSGVVEINQGNRSESLLDLATKALFSIA